MKLFKFIYPIFYYLFFISWCFASAQGTIKIIDSNNLTVGKVNYIKEHQYYISVNNFSDILLNNNFTNSNTEKMVVYFGDTKIKITANISFVIIDEKVYQLHNNVFQKKGEYYVPLDDFLALLTQHTNTEYSMDYNSMSINLGSVIQNIPESKTIDLAEEKKKWQFDTIIIDPGHGGKDPGSVGYKGTKEKDIVLDVSKRLARKIQKNSRIKTVLTRDEDVFVRLQDRTKFANTNEGDLFISIHVNSNESKKPSGFETYLLKPGRNQEAINVALRENSVIELEGNEFEKLTDEQLIQATIAQSGFVQYSEKFAALIQEEIDKRVQSRNRGVKQAGFYVLMGASMPNVLIELGYISNPNEEKKLNSSSYRDMLATSIYYAILQYQKILND
ncbi:MAG: N-acetylmuramoyl-L-alanine amidase [Candidatus Neomarinimicrobiota bacterium]|nr:N-acetylmuramoyl-L-alanine amidase [Candidatus Neomarinimicrobiota bacterium]MEE3301457.1 N-acetylmuramoyl-L-alanine amidase [Candidatus Neomarinimicrobiota bacterium]